MVERTTVVTFRSFSELTLSTTKWVMLLRLRSNSVRTYNVYGLGSRETRMQDLAGRNLEATVALSWV